MARRLTWHGKDIEARLLKATRQGTDETTAACVNDAKPNTPVVTGILQGSERAEPAEIKGDIVSADWGSFDVNYALFIEEREFMLRNAADKEYPKLAGRIKKRYGK